MANYEDQNSDAASLKILLKPNKSSDEQFLKEVLYISLHSLLANQVTRNKILKSIKNSQGDKVGQEANTEYNRLSFVLVVYPESLKDHNNNATEVTVPSGRRSNYPYCSDNYGVPWVNAIKETWTLVSHRVPCYNTID